MDYGSAGVDYGSVGVDYGSSGVDYGITSFEMNLFSLLACPGDEFGIPVVRNPLRVENN